MIGFKIIKGAKEILLLTDKHEKKQFYLYNTEKEELRSWQYKNQKSKGRLSSRIGPG